jgi:transcriptional regulator with XRE-family HTH domain
MNRLVFYRRRIGLTQSRVSHLLGHPDVSMLSRYENDISVPPLPAAFALEVILRVPVAFLFPGLYDEIRARIRSKEEQLATLDRSRATEH